ncbi:MAG: hypothetical protein ACREL1_02200, partial [bacterium]
MLHLSRAFRSFALERILHPGAFKPAFAEPAAILLNGRWLREGWLESAWMENSLQGKGSKCTRKMKHR